MIRNFNLVKNVLRTQGDRLDEMAETLGRLQAKDKQEEKYVSLATNLLPCSTVDDLIELEEILKESFSYFSTNKWYS